MALLPVLLPVLLLLPVLRASPALAQALRAGTYAVEGTDPEGNGYAGTAQLQVGPDGVWRVLWVNPQGSTVSGVGLVTGELFSASFYAPGEKDGTPVTGIAVFRILPDGRLRGVWSHGTGLGEETLTPR
ncbi:hypothetical protein M0638_09570 [Roseomonas sp. NAR14]|uniref:Uncharacterized protein n=1 Tax=Roseomonas acroporae TaxID=2937791 RepID=A0A9X1Y7M9_9PROT|nr:hypothetical protein [Roseomonas acroporae]MCK8784630.1 hypothetical protein [Roseomonas acroporae]